MKNVIALLAFLFPAFSFGQMTMQERVVRGGLDVMHEYFISQGFTEGLLKSGDEHPREMLEEVLQSRLTIEEGRKDVAHMLREMGKPIDEWLTKCGSSKMYSSCTSQQCFRAARKPLRSCVGETVYVDVDQKIGEIEELYGRLNSPKTEVGLDLQQQGVEIAVIGLHTRAQIALAGQNLFAAEAGMGMPDKVDAATRAKLFEINMQQNWKMAGELLGCQNGELDKAIQAYQETPNFLDVTCEVVNLGLEKTVVETIDFIRIFEPTFKDSDYIRVE